MELEKREIEQTVYIEANYPQTISWNLDDILEEINEETITNIQKKDILELKVLNWGVLLVRTKNKEYKIDGIDSDDWKRSVSNVVYDKDYKEIREENN